MNRGQFAKIFEEYQEDARRAVRTKFQGNAALADDAVQNAAVYVLENIGRFKKLTLSYFIQLVVNRARNGRRGETRQQMRAVSVGGHEELVKIEHVLEAKRRGRVLRLPDADEQEGGDPHRRDR